MVINTKKDCKNNVIKNLLSNQKGMALLTTLIFVFVLVTFGVSLLIMTSNDTKLSTLQRDSTKAFYI
ncbi:MAG: pilus assembly PilX N-terminal domain-containing protein, partial [Patescibacteria group bacterium]